MVVVTLDMLICHSNWVWIRYAERVNICNDNTDPFKLIVNLIVV